MKIRQRIGSIPDGSKPRAGVSVAVRLLADGTTVETLLSDADGFVDLQRNGHLAPHLLFVGNVPGGDKSWRSDAVQTAGVVPLAEVPAILSALGDGVIRGYEDELAVSLVSNGPSLSVAPGAANVQGHPVVTYSAVGLSNSRPVSTSRIDRAILRLSPTGSATTPGKADVVLLQGTAAASPVAPTLTQTSTVYEVSLAQVLVPSAGIVVVTDERAYAGEKATEVDVVRADSVTTTSGSGEALAGLEVTLLMPRKGRYDIEAEFSAIQRNSASITDWVLQGTFGSLGSGNNNFDTPGQVAVDGSGNVYIADTGNDRLVKRNSSGTFVDEITVLPNITGVAVDASGNIYVIYGDDNIHKYNSSLVLQWTHDIFGVASTRHISTDGGHIYITDVMGDVVRKHLCSTGAFVISWGTTGTGNGQFDSPHGIVVNSTHVYVTELGNHRVQKFTKTGSFVTKWGTNGTDDGEFQFPYAVAIDSHGDAWVADDANGVQRFSNTGVFKDSPVTDMNQRGLAFATGDILWTGNATLDSISKWDEDVTPGGYGQIAIEIDGSVSPYAGPGQRDTAISAVETGSKQGPGTVLVRAFGKATADTLTLRSAVLSARAVPRR